MMHLFDTSNEVLWDPRQRKLLIHRSFLLHPASSQVLLPSAYCGLCAVRTPTSARAPIPSSCDHRTVVVGAPFLAAALHGSARAGCRRPALRRLAMSGDETRETTTELQDRSSVETRETTTESQDRSSSDEPERRRTPPRTVMPQFVFYCFIHEAAAIRPPRSTTMATPFNRPALRPRGSPALRLAMTNGAPLRPSMPTVAARTPASAGALPLCPGDATKPAPEVSLWWTPRSTGRVLSALASRSVSSFSLLLPLSYVALL
jgi:hypothetical protein